MNRKTRGILTGFIPFAAYLVGFSALIMKELKKKK
jgi:hypothetical protein